MAITAAQRTLWLIHAVEPRSQANGPGGRFTIWSQGCTLGCPGCFNPGTHDPGGTGQVRTVAELLAEALAEASGIDGVTLTGGEPLEQPAAVAAFCAGIRQHGRRGSDLGIVILSGFTRAEIEQDPVRAAAVRDADMVIAGRYNAHRRVATGLRGSDNKTYWARTGRYRPEDFAAVPDLEIAIGTDGMITISGMPL